MPSAHYNSLDVLNYTELIVTLNTALRDGRLLQGRPTEATVDTVDVTVPGPGLLLAGLHTLGQGILGSGSQQVVLQ